MTRWATAFSCLVLPMLLNCSQPQGRTFPAKSPTSLRLGADTLPAEAITAPHRLDPGKKGEILLWLGNPDERERTVEALGAQPARILLPPQKWTRTRLRTESKLELRWNGGPLHLGPVYLIGAKRKPNLLLLSIDTLRADAFTPELMPELFRLFSGGTRFEQTYAAAPWTLPSHASLLTGLYPAAHGVRLPNQKLSHEVDTLAEQLRDAGYYNLAVTEGNYVSALFGLEQGFHQFHEDPPQMMDRDLQKISRLEANLGYLNETMAGLEDLPKFVFLHSYEVHCPFLPRNGLQDPEDKGSTQWLLDHHGKTVDEADFKHLRALYDGEVRYLDARLAPLLRSLHESGEWILVVTSDHGEEFGDHGGLLHGNTLYEEVTHVPLAILGAKIAATRDQTRRSLVDLAPTLLELLGIERRGSMQGLDLFDKNGRHPALYAESFFFGPAIPSKDPRIAGIWCESDKLIQIRNFDQFEAKLYQLSSDPLERKNLEERETNRRDALFLLLQAYLDNKPFDATTMEHLPPEQIEIMRSLGYIK